MSEVFMELYEEYVDMIYRISLIFLKDIPDTEDAVQDIFIKLLKNKKSFHSKEHEKAWIIVVTQNHCKNLLLSPWRLKRNILDKVKEASHIEDSTERDFIWQEISNLPNKYKIVIYLYYYEGYDTNEIAKILSINSSTIRSRLSKARELLKPKLKEVYL